MALPWTALTAALTLTLAGCASTVPGAPATEAIPSPTSTQAQQRPAGPPVGDTVNVTLALADSFDINADGTCSGRSDNAGMTNGERVQLRGETDGGSVSSTVTTRLERRDAIPGIDDGLCCIVTMEFTPRYPDPKGVTAQVRGRQLALGTGSTQARTVRAGGQARLWDEQDDSADVSQRCGSAGQGLSGVGELTVRWTQRRGHAYPMPGMPEARRMQGRLVDGQRIEYHAQASRPPRHFTRVDDKGEQNEVAHQSARA